MGVPKLLAALKHIGIIQNNTSDEKPSEVESLWFDLPSLIHEVASTTYKYNEKTTEAEITEMLRKTETQLEETFHSAILDKIVSITTQVNPKRLLYIAIDGVPIVAKMVQQRGRRYMASHNRNPRTPFDTNNLTSGTLFMERLNTAIKKWIQDKRDLLPPVVLYSSHNEPGEGEHKMMDEFRKGLWFNPNGSHIIYGNDTDLFLLSLLLPYRNIYLWRVEKYRDFPSLIDIEKARNKIKERIETNTAIEDFVVISFFLGNDFIPRHPALENFNTTVSQLITLLAEIKEPLVKDGNLWWKQIMRLIKLLAIVEPTALAQTISNKMVERSSVLDAAYNRDNKTFSYNTYRDRWYERAINIESQYGGLDNVNIDEMVINYLDMFNLVYHYYTKGGNAINKRIYYRYFYAPLFSDLLKIGVKNISEVVNKAVWADKAENYLHPVHLLVGVLPLHSSGLYPKSVLNQLRTNIRQNQEWKRLWPTRPPIRDMEGQPETFTGPVLIPNVPINLLITLKIPKKESDRYYTETTLIDQVEEEEKLEIIEITDPWEDAMF